MAEFIANTLAEVAVGSNVLFTDTVVAPCPCVRHRRGSGIFTLRGGHTYLVTFSANIGATDTPNPVSLAITLGGEELQGTRMDAVPATVGALQNVSKTTEIYVPCGCCYTMAIENVGGFETFVDNANLVIHRED